MNYDELQFLESLVQFHLSHQDLTTARPIEARNHLNNLFDSEAN